MKKIVLALSLLVSSMILSAQKNIDVVPKDYEIEKIKRAGLSVNIELSEKYVSNLWEKQLKDYGKYASKKKTYQIDIANIPSVSSSPVKVYSAVESSSKGTMLWMAIDMGDKYVVEGGEGYSSTKKLLRDFAISCFKADLEDQVKDATKAFENSVKSDEKTIKEGEKLVNNLQTNASDKLKLEEALKKNAEEKVQLEKDIDQNKKDQSSSKQEVEKMKKAMEIKQAELNNLK